MIRYRDLVLDAPEAERMAFWSSEDEAGGEDLAAWLASIGGAEGGEPELPAGEEGYGSFGVVESTPSSTFGDSGEESAS
jgi:hypothetical protein